ncbi:tRNA (adenosine(37)-N6)-threonylcarbamoyltransferase complex ATPase subunit type 1 TsaE [Aerobium aerolatum]|uniref:tRNA threonylcarbamoyladenosine biosynthesis protein TsaE n=1 Tax=Aquamicrobium aerolatum DSM 21857 TaxID=1121003 RepID=A0A1I3NRI0_9HYPH|nr:tRNA (adenosine(37)-N6)-threonylcarbamoyltransferase complex ATPase subunit type 1 TsaE [Aquamicrobium aerolatum]SFJ11792.1 hypothetical protein SAMN03080618_02121 [Aquamicrobium aerolatum DSM 21857]
MIPERVLLTLDLPDEQASNQLGEDIAAALRIADVLLLSGDLGMGKSTLARAIIRAMAGNPELEVPSPTFTLVQAYPTRVPIQHYDLYRLGAPDELEELGFSEAIRDGAVLVEWPERAAEDMPKDAVRLSLSEKGQGRTVSIDAPVDFAERLQRSLLIRRFLDDAGWQHASRNFLVGDASTRAYESVCRSDGTAMILMNAPRRPDGPPIRDGKPYSRIAHLAESVTPFVAIAKVLRDAGFAAPQIPAADLDNGLLLVENLGTQGVLDAHGIPIAERYIASAELLARMHMHQWPQRIEIAPDAVHVVPAYDRVAMAIEIELLTDWYLPYVTGTPTGDEDRAEFAHVWEQMFDLLDDAEKTLVLRDYHSPNIIWREDRRGDDRVGIIDFQDAVIGPAAYDVASLAMDARVTISPELEAAAVDAYCATRARLGVFDREQFETAYAIMAAQRNTKIIGIFVRLDQRDGKPAYLKHLPRIREYLSRALAHPRLAPLVPIYRKAGIL